MKFASFRHRGADLVGVSCSDSAFAVIEGISDMVELITLADAAAERIHSALRQGMVVQHADLEWQPPVRRPGKICGVAMNNSASNERKISAPDHPAFFLKPSSCLVGHGQAVRIRPYYGSVHPEPELAVVIGRKTRDIAAQDAMSCLFGFTIFNDLTGNGMRADDLFHYWALYADEDNPHELERREQHLSYAARYKGTDTFGCMGPAITTADEIGDPDNLRVTCAVGGEIVAEDSTQFYNYRIAELVSYISQYLTLDPGDIISCGTAFKPAAGRKSIHHANLQKMSGPIEVTIEGLGKLCNPVVVEDKAIGQWQLS